MAHDLESALGVLVQAHGHAQLVQAFYVLQRQVLTKRRDEHKQIGPLARAYREAMALRDQMRATGATADDLHRGFTSLLRDHWPFTRDWKYLCQTCGDIGLEIRQCPGDQAACGREQLHLAHDYGAPCWCDKGRRFREKPKPEASEFTDAGKTPKRSGFQKFGR